MVGDGGDEADLIAALKRRDEAVFIDVVTRYQGALVRLALTFTQSRAVAEEIAQDTWLAVITGIDRFEARASFKTWLFRILVNRARTRSEREGRTVPFSAFDGALDAGGPAVPPERFLGADHPDWAHHWSSPPRSWSGSPEDRLLSAESMTLISDALAKLPPGQRQVITLRDVDGWSAEEVCNALEISETNQRVLLHRARSRVRAQLEKYFDAE